MKLMQCIFFFLFISSGLSYANENKYIFIGQNGNGHERKVAFILELAEDDLGDNFQIKKGGEVYLKVDKIVSVPKDAFAIFTLFKRKMNPEVDSNEEVGARWLSISASIYPEEGEEHVRCKNSQCGYIYYASPGYRYCQKCGTLN